jgi:hypothetical protein
VAIRCQRLRTCRKRYCEEFVAIATQSIWRLRRSLVGPGAEINNATSWDRDCRGISGGFSARGPSLMGYRDLVFEHPKDRSADPAKNPGSGGIHN